MRPNNQNKRSRGRNGGRKHSNPLSRNFESNGPDVKIRGNASHVAEKYVQLARDAQASGDSVMAENYLQHAEHYFRVISAAQAQNAQRNDQQSPSGSDDDDDYETQAERGEARSDRDDMPARENAKSAEKAETGSGDSQGEGDQEKPGKPRRPRRKRVTEEAKETGGKSDPADAPQPELPAFLTGSSPADAAE